MNPQHRKNWADLNNGKLTIVIMSIAEHRTVRNLWKQGAGGKLKKNNSKYIIIDIVAVREIRW